MACYMWSIRTNPRTVAARNNEASEILWWAPKDVCNVTERIIAVQGQFRNHTRSLILAPIESAHRYGELIGKKSTKLPVRTHPSLINRLRSG